MTAATLTDADFLRRLAKATGRACGLSGGFYYCELSGGLTGWIQPHPDTSCLQVVIASYLGLHPCEVPCPPVDQRLADVRVSPPLPPTLIASSLSGLPSAA